MKKITFLLSLVFAFLGGITASAQVQLGEALDRSTWSVSASSWCYDTGKIGNITDIKDGKTNTYWHSNWSASGTGLGGSMPEYFIVDLGEVKEISGFGYVREMVVMVSVPPIKSMSAKHRLTMLLSLLQMRLIRTLSRIRLAK